MSRVSIHEIGRRTQCAAGVSLAMEKASVRGKLIRAGGLRA
jgi:hypothetical protein